MNDLDIMKRAQSYIESLANGVDPLTGSDLPESDIVNNVRISRCLFYVSDVLKKVIDNGGEVAKPKEKAKRKDKADFALTDEQAAQLEPVDDDITVSGITDIVNALINEDTMKKLKAATVNRWLMQTGMLSEYIINGKSHKKPTPAGEGIGIKAVDKVSFQGTPYTACFYTPEAQQFVIDNIDAIAEFAAQE